MSFEKSLIGRPETIRVQKSLFEHWVEPNVSKLGFDNIRVWINFLQENNLETNTIISIVSVLKKYAHFMGKNLNTKGYKKLLPIIKERVRCWTKDEAIIAKKICQKQFPKFYGPFLTALHTGMRYGEVFGLRGGEIDFINRKIYIVRGLNGPTKNSRSRTIKMSEELEKVLQSFYVLGRDDSPIFPMQNANQIMKTICKTGNIRSISFHGLRHTYATLLLEAGVSPKRVQISMGHSKLSTLLDTYWNIVNDNVDVDVILP